MKIASRGLSPSAMRGRPSPGEGLQGDGASLYFPDAVRACPRRCAARPGVLCGSLSQAPGFPMVEVT